MVAPPMIQPTMAISIGQVGMGAIGSAG